MKTLIVHIGPYKTGSTAIQKVLAASRRSLESAGILYPTSRKTLPLEAHHSLARFMRTGPGPGISLVYGPDELAATFEPPRRVWLDGRPAGRCRHLEVAVEPDALIAYL